MVEQPSVRLQKAREPLRVDVDAVVADVLDHSDAGDRVEGLAGQVAVVHHAYLDPITHAGLLRP